MRIASSVFLGLFGAALAATSANAGMIMFADGDFAANWSISTYAGAAGGQTAAAGTPGNPDNGWIVTTVTGSSTLNANLNSTFVYDPSSQGAITSLDFMLEYRVVSAFGEGHGVSSVLARQDGSIFIADSFVTGSTDSGWEMRAGTGLSAGAFSLAAGAGALDFSAAGSAIEFGFRTANSGGNGIQVAYDNYKVTLHTQDVPEAPVLPLLAAGLGALAIGRLRRS